MGRGTHRPANAQSVVRSGDQTRSMPATGRGLRKREQLIAAARVVFERDGFLASRLTDITAEAKTSIGSFYSYFKSKEEIFAAVLEAAKQDMLHPGIEHISEDSDPAEIIEASNRAYFESYQRNAKLMELLEQVASVDPEFREMRRRRSTEFVRRNAASVRGLQSRGFAAADLDPELTSRALSLMVSRLAFHAFVIEGTYTIDELVKTATHIWCLSLGISPPKQ